MGWLAAQGAIMAIGLFIGLVCSVIGLFFGHIILFDSIALGIAAGVCCNQFTAIHPALCLVIGVATFLLLLWLQNTSIGFVEVSEQMELPILKMTARCTPVAIPLPSRLPGKSHISGLSPYDNQNNRKIKRKV